MPRKRRAHELNARHLENDVEATIVRRMHENYSYRPNKITPSNERKTRDSFGVNNWHIQRRKQFIRYVALLFILYSLLSITHRKRAFVRQITRLVIYSN